MMRESKAIEKLLVEELKKLGVTSLQDTAAKAFLKTSQKCVQQQKLSDAAPRYAAMAFIVGKESPTVALQAAQFYQKAGHKEDAARWFLQASKLLAKHYPAKAIAALRRYTQLNPDDVTNPYQIYELCGNEYSATESLLHGLTAENRAAHRLVSSQLFEAFDKSNFNALLQGLRYRQFSDGEVLTKMGEPAMTMYIVISGALSGYLIFKGKRTYLGDASEDDICGEMAYFTGSRRTAEIVAKGETEVFELPYALLDKFKDDFVSFRQKIEEKYKTRILEKQLALTPVFSDIDVDVRIQVAKVMTTIHIKAGETLFQEHSEGTDLYVVRSGKLAVTINIKGCESLVKTVETSGVVGEMSIVVNGKRTATVRTITDTVLMRLNAEDYRKFCAQCEGLRKSLQALKQIQVKETLHVMKSSVEVDGDDTCAILLHAIWKGT